MIKIRKQAIVQYLLIYLMLLFQGSVMIKVYQDMILVLTMIVCMGLVLLKPVRYFGKREDILLIVPVILCLLFSSVTNAGSLSLLSIGNILIRLLISVVVVYYDKENFVRRYVKMVYVFAIISLIGFVIQMIAPQVFVTCFPKRWTMYHASPIFAYAYKIHQKRNIGIYGEPGLYVIVLMTAIYFVLFFHKKCGFTAKKSRRVLLVLMATMVTTLSTTGYIILLCVLGCWYLKRTAKKESNFKWFMVIFGILIVSADLLMGENGFIWKTIVNKLFDSTGGVSVSATGRARIVSMLADLELVKRYPWGAGFQIYEKLWKGIVGTKIPDTSSCMGITRAMATLGLPCVICYYSVLLPRLSKNKDLFARAACLCIFSLTTATQPDIFYPALISMFIVDSGMWEGKNKLKTERDS